MLLLMAAAFAVGHIVRLRGDRRGRGGAGERDSDFEGYIVSAVLGLLALMLAFTYSLAISRFEERRQVVVNEANAIGTAYLRAQLLSEPHRQRLSGLYAAYVDDKLALANARYLPTSPTLAKDDFLLTQIWAAVAAATGDSRTAPQVSYALVESTNSIVDLDAWHRSLWKTRIPGEVYTVLWFYLIASSGLLGYELGSRRGRAIAAFVLLLLTMSLILIIDIDRPDVGTIRESEAALQDLRASLAHQPPAVFDRWRAQVPN